jgi:hypothetical protein
VEVKTLECFLFPSPVKVGELLVVSIVMFRPNVSAI